MAGSLQFLIPRLLLGLLLDVTVAMNATDACEPEQWSALQVDITPMMPTTPQWQKELEETAHLVSKELNEEKEKHDKELADQTEKDRKAKIQKRADAVTGALTAFNKALPAIQNCVKAAAGKCDGKGMTISVIQALGELKPLVSLISEGVGRFVPLVGAFGQMLALCIGKSPSQPQPPISIKDVRMAVSQELYNFDLEKTVWKFSSLINALDDRVAVYSSELNSKSLDKMAAWYENVFTVDRGHIMNWVTQIMEGYEGIVGSKSSFRATQLAAKKPFKGDCETKVEMKGRIGGVASLEACSLAQGKTKADCVKEMDDAIESYENFKKALEQFKMLGDSMNSLGAVVLSIKNARGCSWEEEGQSAKVTEVQPKPKRWPVWWRKKKASLVVSAPKDYCSAVDSFFKDFKRILDKLDKVKDNFEVLDGQSCASKPYVPWALAQKSTTCPGLHNCNYGNLIHSCGTSCADLGLVYYFDSLYDSKCEDFLKPHKKQPSWPHVRKRSLEEDKPEKLGKPTFCNCPKWPVTPTNYLCAERNYCVKEPCLKYFTDESVW